MGQHDQNPDLERLYARCRRGDAEAWGVLVASLQSLVYSIPKRYGLNEEDADDVFQTTFQALHRNLDRIESGRAIPKWIAVTAARECLRLKRIADRTILADDFQLSLDEVIKSDDVSAEAEAVVAERAERVRHAMKDLTDRCRQLLGALYAEEGNEYAEVAQRLGIPLGAIGPTRARCLEKLRKILEKEDFFG